MTGYIYTLTCPIKNQVIYIGCTTVGLENRLYGHTATAKSNNQAIGAYISTTGIKPIIELIEEVNVDSKNELISIENYWIGQFRQWGFDLLNGNKPKPKRQCVTIKAKVESAALLKVLAAQTGETMMELFDRVVREELDAIRNDIYNKQSL